jgi:hypothetical protein
MNEQQLAAVKRALEALKRADSRDGYLTYITEIEALQSIIAQHALDKKAKNARELGLSYDDAVKGGVGIMLGGERIDPASIYAEPKIGCVNHDCDKCKAAQPAPVQKRPQNCGTGYCSCIECVMEPEPAQTDAWPCVIAEADFEQNTITLEMQCSDYKVGAGQHWLHTTPPAPQPVPVKTCHDGKPWPVAPKPWVGLTDEEMVAAIYELEGFVFGLDNGNVSDRIVVEYARLVEAELKEKNHG